MCFGHEVICQMYFVVSVRVPLATQACRQKINIGLKTSLNRCSITARKGCRAGTGKPAHEFNLKMETTGVEAQK